MRQKNPQIVRKFRIDAMQSNKKRGSRRLFRHFDFPGLKINFFFLINFRDCVDSANWDHCLVGHWKTGHKGNLSVSFDGGFNVRRLNFFSHDVARLQHGSHPIMYSIRFQNEKNTGKFQRSEIHRFHYVFDLHRLVGFRPHLLRN